MAIPAFSRVLATPWPLLHVVRWRRPVVTAVIVALVAGSCAIVMCRAETGWDAAIDAFEADDRARDYPDDAVLFIGSSSIRLWSTLAADMAPHTVTQRGFGGATMADVVRHADRLLGERQPPALVLFVGNDISGDADGNPTPEAAADRFRTFIEIVARKTPRTTILIVAITPTPQRWARWPRIRDLNTRLAALCDATPNTMLVPTEDIFLGGDGLPRPELFQKDSLHLSPAGYAAWNRRIRSYLDPLMKLEPAATGSRSRDSR